MHAAAYWGSGMALLVAEKLMPQGLIARYKIQPNRSVGVQELLKLLKLVLGNQAGLLLLYLGVRKIRSAKIDAHCQEIVDRPVPGWRQVALEYIFNLLTFEVVFYILHWALHQRVWYKRIHKVHHEFKAPLGLCSEYAHPVELILSNVVPGAIGPLITGAHPLSTWIFLVGSIFMTNVHHSGFIWPWYPFNSWTMFHDYHHANFYDQFGVVGLMDRLFKTTGGSDFNDYKTQALKRVMGV